MVSAQRPTRRASARLAAAARFLAASLGLFLAGALLAAPWAVTTAQTEANFGPHDATYAVTTDGAITIDLGPIGQLVIPAGDRLPLGLGVDVAVEEIPNHAGVPVSTIDELAQDASSYASLFGDIDALVTVVRNGIIADALTRDLIAAGVVTVVAGAYLLHRRTRLQPETASERDPADGPMTALVLSLAAVLIAIIAVPVSAPKQITPNPVFERTPLAGSEVTGRFSGVIDEVARVVTDYYNDNETFYDTARTSLDVAWLQRPTSPRTTSGADLVPRPNWDQPLDGDQSADGDGAQAAIGRTATGEGATGGATGGAADGGQAQAGGQAGAQQGEPAGIITVLMASDIHCNTGMSRVLARAAQLSGADLYLDGGDITMTGTTAENICVDSVHQALPHGLPRLYVKGNHDSADTAAHARSLGWQVLDGQPVTAAGLTFFGLPDPRRTVFPTGDVLERGETGAGFTDRVAAEACAAENIDTLVIHDPRQAAAALGEGCAGFAVSGHWHRRVGPEAFGPATRFVNSTTGGALANALTPGPLKMPAEFSFIRYDAQTRQPIDVQVVTVDMDAQVSFSPWTSIPQPGPWAPAEAK
ncbi:metallophosphoesterase [Brevibacterium sp. p3-SID960]|uniref:metallophosphoesterase family protein n=1 Tax=Brevibacterium sp. p3-SID960 TaxID=2916063 RepID=UPI0021A471CB|nr:metallophosphoesterase family protein [Brevibacterium sp. p3-SID960]MCT1689522.1 metallophosphoesterase [Brevibacterium sp. p3-SID960]